MIVDGQSLTKDNEGYRETIYLDSLGHPTCGYGICLDPVGVYQSVKEYHERRFAEEYGKAEAEYGKLKFDLDDVRRAAVVDLLYNLGDFKFYKFRNFAIALRNRDWELAAQHLENSLWFKQVARRGPRICALIRSGKWEALP